MDKKPLYTATGIGVDTWKLGAEDWEKHVTVRRPVHNVLIGDQTSDESEPGWTLVYNEVKNELYGTDGIVTESFLEQALDTVRVAKGGKVKSNTDTRMGRRTNTRYDQNHLAKAALLFIYSHKFTGGNGLTNDKTIGTWDTASYFHPDSDNSDVVQDIVGNLFGGGDGDSDEISQIMYAYLEDIYTEIGFNNPTHLMAKDKQGGYEWSNLRKESKSLMKDYRQAILKEISSINFNELLDND